LTFVSEGVVQSKRFMIPNQWYVILESKEVKPGKLVGVRRMGEKLVLWRDAQGQVACLSDRCPHRGAALSAGRVACQGSQVQCPFHGFEFDAAGRCQLIPAIGRKAGPPKVMQARAYPVREAHGFIYLWWGEAPAPAVLPPLPFFDTLDEARYSQITFRDPWATHYSRAIENQLDVVHLPFVHYNTIGRGNRTLVNGPLTRITPMPGHSDLLELWVYNDLDHDQQPLKPHEIPEPVRHPFLQFRFPNLWQNWISDDMRLVVAFVPVDDENMLMYLRVYQRFVTAPILRNLVNLANAWFSLIIERQDRRVVITQQPKRSDLRIGEHPISGDDPIIKYRRRRRELIEAAESASARPA
jgi:phenylpropionate dioxygenase-like ring-hydroxylating dioxygenase large terminal subunit